jgi:hypothetical protein
MNAKLVQAVRVRLADNAIEDLLRLWRENDRERYSAEAFEAARLILVERGVELPAQEEWKGPVPVAGKARSIDPASDEFWMGWLRPVLWVGIVLGALGTVHLVIQVVYDIMGPSVLTGWWGFRAITVVAEQWLELLLPVLLMVNAAGCLKRKQIFRTAMLVWAWLWLGRAVLVLMSVGVSELLYGEREGLSWVNWLVYVLYGEGFRAIYPLVVLFLLTRPQIKRLFDVPVWGFDLSGSEAPANGPDGEVPSGVASDAPDQARDQHGGE